MDSFEEEIKKRGKRLNQSTFSMAFSTSTALAVGACGGGSGVLERKEEGFPTSYIPPESDYDSPTDSDPYLETLKIPYVEPYWVSALQMDGYELHILPLLTNYERTIEYVFSELQPDYDHYQVTGWQPATDLMKIATREVLAELELVLNVSFKEGSTALATNVIAIGQSNQVVTSGMSYYPNSYYQIGMDVFISTDFSSPQFTSKFLTNYDYEVLVHELGHALGLKHPFEEHGENNVVLSSYEDHTANTAMSYDSSPENYNGTLRPLDWMTLTKLYGVKSTYRPNDDTYSFSSSKGVFIIDGSGVDTISALGIEQDVTVDCRPGAHSYIGNKSVYVTDANQLTISHGSDIENVETGSGDDTIIGNNLDNYIVTGSGKDTIFSGDGADIIEPGTGADRIDLSEEIQFTDSVLLSTDPLEHGFDTIFSFLQGAMGDTLNLGSLLASVPEMFPLVTLGNAPTANFSNGILRIIGNDLKSSSDLLNAFQVGGGLEQLAISNGANSIIISADSQETGSDQCIFHVKGIEEHISISHLAILQGNGLDIDQWHEDNFTFIA